MSQEKVSKWKTGKKTPAKILLEERAAKAAIRDENSNGLKMELSAVNSKPYN